MRPLFKISLEILENMHRDGYNAGGHNKRNFYSLPNYIKDGWVYNGLNKKLEKTNAKDFTFDLRHTPLKKASRLTSPRVASMLSQYKEFLGLDIGNTICAKFPKIKKKDLRKIWKFIKKNPEFKC